MSESLHDIYTALKKYAVENPNDKEIFDVINCLSKRFPKTKYPFSYMQFSNGQCPIYEHVQEVFKKSKKGDVIVFANDTYKVFDKVEDYESYVKDLIELGVKDLGRAVPHFQVISNNVTQKMVFVCGNANVDDLKDIKKRLLTFFTELKEEDIIILPIEKPSKTPKLFGEFDDQKSVKNFDVILNSMDNYDNNRKKIDNFKHEVFCDNDVLGKKISNKSVIKTSNGEKYIIVNITLPQLSNDCEFNVDNLKNLPPINITISNITNSIVAKDNGVINAGRDVANNSVINQERKETVEETIKRWILANPPTDKQSQFDYYNTFNKFLNLNIKLRIFNNFVKAEGFIGKRVKDYYYWSNRKTIKINDKVKI
jgi:hypothetical protein